MMAVMAIDPRVPAIIHIGQALVDEIIRVPSLPQRGGNTVAEYVGLQAAGSVNVLVAAARSGGRGVQAGTIGEGRHGDLIRNVLEREGVEIANPPLAGIDTGICVVLIEPSAERTFITTQGAERQISVESLDASGPQPHDYVCVTGYSLQGPTRDPLLAWLEALPEGCHVVLDPGADFVHIDAETRERMLAVTTIWTSNAQEAEDITGEAAMVDSAPKVAELLAPTAIVIVRDGPEGCVVHHDGQTVVVPGFPQKPIDTNGAGDAHTGVLVAELSQRIDPIEAAIRANAAGAIKVTRSGPATAPGRAEITAFLNGWPGYPENWPQNSRIAE